ncbi:MAG: hypothetical protein ACPG4T_22055, partial [Nannocystaceae bacterium]
MSIVSASALAGLFVLAPAEAPPVWELQWQAPRGCPQAADVRAAVARNLGRRQVRTKQQISASVRKAETGWKLELAIEGSGGVRTLKGAAC